MWSNIKSTPSSDFFSLFCKPYLGFLFLSYYPQRWVHDIQCWDFLQNIQYSQACCHLFNANTHFCVVMDYLTIQLIPWWVTVCPFLVWFLNIQCWSLGLLPCNSGTTLCVLRSQTSGITIADLIYIKCPLLVFFIVWFFIILSTTKCFPSLIFFFIEIPNAFIQQAT